MLAMGGCMAGMAAQETETETEKEEWKAPEGFESPPRGSGGVLGTPILKKTLTGS